MLCFPPIAQVERRGNGTTAYKAPRNTARVPVTLAAADARFLMSGPSARPSGLVVLVVVGYKVVCTSMRAILSP